MPATLRMQRVLALPFIVLALLFASFVTAPDAQALTRSQMVGNGFTIAKNQIGDPYRYGAAGPGAFDCSGLLHFSYRRAGFSNFPRTSDAQYRFVRHISKANLRPGDFVFMHRNGDVYHAAIFAGWRDGKRIILHAGRPGERVKRSPIWTTSWFAGTLRPA